MAMTPAEALVALRPWIDKQVRSAWRPVASTDGHQNLLTGFSGLPLLRPGEEWPKCQDCSLPMELLVQLELDQLPGKARFGGVLQLFYCVTGGMCERGWEQFANHSSCCRIVQPDECRLAPASQNRFPPKAITGWESFQDLPDPCEHERLGIKSDYHFQDVPFQPMEMWCPELNLHFVGAKYLDALGKAVCAAECDKVGGWPRWIQHVAYPACPECGAEMEVVMQIASEDHIPYMFGDCGVGHITQCPRHPAVVTFGWDCC